MPNTSDHDVVGKLRRMGFSLNDLPEHGVRQRRNVDQRSKYNQSLGRSDGQLNSDPSWLIDVIASAILN